MSINYIDTNLGDVIIHPCSNFKGGKWTRLWRQGMDS